MTVLHIHCVGFKAFKLMHMEVDQVADMMMDLEVDKVANMVIKILFRTK